MGNPRAGSACARRIVSGRMAHEIRFALIGAAALAKLAAGKGNGGSVLRVDDDAPPGGDGASWATAYAYLQDALAVAADPGNGITEIRVAAGRYLPDRSERNPDGTGERGAAFELVDGVILLGGFAGLGGPAVRRPVHEHDHGALLSGRSERGRSAGDGRDQAR
jgi:hypothetical protein